MRLQLMVAAGLAFAAGPLAAQPTRVALSGTAAPAGGTYSSNFSNPVLNGAGQVAFFANLTGPGITAANDRALFAGLPGGVVRVVAEGDVLDVDPGVGVDNRTVADINFLSVSGGEDGRGVSFSDTGLLVYQLLFTGGSSGVFTSQITPVPEPSGLLLAAGFGWLALRARRRAFPLAPAA